MGWYCGILWGLRKLPKFEAQAMATLSGIKIADSSSLFDSGAAFLLAQKCKVNEIVSLKFGYEIEVCQNSPYVVVRLKAMQDFDDTFNKGYETIQQGLDILSVSGKADLSIKDLSECLVWWRENSLQKLRIVSFCNLPITVYPVNIEQTDSNSNIISNIPPLTPMLDHESMRYFRLAQTTDDVFEAFRNMYLSFESLLNDIHPKKKEEGEGDWLRNALTKVDKLTNLSQVFSHLNKDIVTYIHADIYQGIRCKLFHAKKRSGILLPQNLQDKKIVRKGLNDLTIVVLVMIDYKFKINPSKSEVSRYFNEQSISLLSNAQMIISDEDPLFDVTKTVKASTITNSVELVTRYAPELSKSNLNFALGGIATSSLQNLRKIAWLGLKNMDNDMLFHAILEAELTIEGIDYLEIQLGIQLYNSRKPKYLLEN